MLSKILTMMGKLADTVNPKGGVDVNIQDQTTRPLFLPFSRGTGVVTTLTAEPNIGDNLIDVVSSAGWSAGQGVGIFPGDDTGRFYFGTVVSAPTGTQLLLDSPVDHAMPVGTTAVVQLDYDMAVDGSGTPQLFTVPGADAFPYDITRLLIVYKTDGAVDLNGFGDSSNPLTNGILVRRADGENQNFFNIKTNLDWAGIAYDANVYKKDNPQGVDAIAIRLTFAGQGKIGVAVRLQDASDSLDVLIQDNLLEAGPFGIVSMKITAEGHKVD